VGGQADIAAKCLYGLLIYKIARLKSYADDPAFAAEEGEHDGHAVSQTTNNKSATPAATA
jgi:hypothetical protein